MNTFLPSNDFVQIARVLDLPRLSRQISECITIFKLLDIEDYCREELGGIPWGLQIAPVVKLWRASTGQLLDVELFQYLTALAEEWRKLHGFHHIAFNDASQLRFFYYSKVPRRIKWDERVHISHRCNLMKKDPGFYQHVFFRESLSFPENYRIKSYEWLNPTFLI